MKTFQRLSKVKRAKLFHHLFADQVPSFLAMLREICLDILENKEINVPLCEDEHLFHPEHWVLFAVRTEKKLSKHGNALAKSATLFAKVLFNGYSAAFMAHFLKKYGKTKMLSYSKFEAAVVLLFL